MEDKELAFTPAWRLKEMLDSRELSPVELTDVYLRRIDALDGQLHSYLTVTGDEARAAAKEAEDRIARGETGALLGLPVAIKDLEITKGIRSTMGSYVFRNTVPDQDSALVERVRNAGGIILGKTNTPEFGSAGITENKLGPPCRNPWDTDRTPGGSSGGAGSALAAGLCPLASGSDAGGSIRIPASFCGVYGIKATFGRVPRVGGLGRPSPNLASHPGPMSRTVRDSAMFLQAIAGHDPRDPNSLREAPPDFTAELNSGVRGLRVAWSTDLGYAAVDPEVASITSASARLFEELGCTVDESDIALDDPIPTFLDIFCTTGYVGNGHLLGRARGRPHQLRPRRHAPRPAGHGRRLCPRPACRRSPPHQAGRPLRPVRPPDDPHHGRPRLPDWRAAPHHRRPRSPPRMGLYPLHLPLQHDWPPRRQRPLRLLIRGYAHRPPHHRCQRPGKRRPPSLRSLRGSPPLGASDASGVLTIT